MSSKLNLSIMSIILVSFSLIVVGHVSAPVNELNLPSTAATIEVYNGTRSYFYTLISGVPAGFDVINRPYRAWCVDRRSAMPRSPATRQVMLFSTYTAPLVLPNEPWDMVNYVLNHKQGGAADIQQAIWYFVNMGDNFTVSSTKALAMINDAEVNGTGFVPGNGQLAAVICYPQETEVQISIIEVPPQTLVTDLNGDGNVNMVDVTMVATAFRSKPGSPKWSNIADMNQDRVLNILDITLVAKDFGRKSP